MTLMKDPTIKTSWPSMFLSASFTAAFTTIAFYSNIIWMQYIVVGCIWGVAFLALFALISILVNDGPTDHNTTISRIPQWWSIFTGIVYSVMLWYFTGGLGYLVIMYLVSKAILSTNYFMVLEEKDRRYTDMINSPLGKIMDRLSKISSKEIDISKKRYWETNKEDEDKE